MYSEMAATTNRKCRVCSTDAYENSNNPNFITLITCPTCGKYRYDSTADLFFSGSRVEQQEAHYRIAYALRTLSERAIGKRDNSYFPIYSHSDFGEMLNRSDPTVQEKLQLLLRFIANRSKYPGEWMPFDAKNDYSVLCARNEGEAQFFMRALVGRELLAAQKRGKLQSRSGDVGGMAGA
jgi:hypothetical protein